MHKSEYRESFNKSANINNYLRSSEYPSLIRIFYPKHENPVIDKVKKINRNIMLMALVFGFRNNLWKTAYLKNASQDVNKPHHRMHRVQILIIIV